MPSSKRPRIAALLVLLVPILALSCGLGSVPETGSLLPTLTYISIPTSPVPAIASASDAQNPALGMAEKITPDPPRPQLENKSAVEPTLAPGPLEPAGCLSAEKQAELTTVDARLAYADQLLLLPRPLSQRVLPVSLNAYTQAKLSPDSGAVSLSVGDVDPAYQVQRAMNALQVAGFVTWLRRIPGKGLQILAISIQMTGSGTSAWEPYIQAYWEGPETRPENDPNVLSALKLPPCRWMMDRGLSPALDRIQWFKMPPAHPDYAAAGAAYLAATNEEAMQVAQRINWLGAGVEGPNTMCGPLAWSILQDAGALPPGYGGWATGPGAFWLAKPVENGRPWSLFPPEWYRVAHVEDPLGTYDFNVRLKLVPGDFLYTYARGDGFEHMLVVTEADENGDLYTVTNLIHMQPVKKTTIERVLLLNLRDPSQGIARNQWANDRINGRTGNIGFDLFRWAWVQKDMDQQAAPYKVLPGDTLPSIAVLWRTPADQIARYNGFKVDEALQVGQVINIPPNP